jgi:hypothetical protein
MSYLYTPTMKIILAASIMLLTFTQSFSKEEKDSNRINELSPSMKLKGHKFSLVYQLFESHDTAGTAIDTVRNHGDYILFSQQGQAYMNFKDKLDSIAYVFPDGKSVSFGDTPFIITYLGKGFYKLYQNEEEANGDYNRVTYLLKKEDHL